jgi:DNA-binding response OmpR family regulator
MNRPVLIIEDEPDIAEGLRYNLEREGLRAVVAETGERGLELALDRNNPPALVLLDLMLPGMSGTELCRRLRAKLGACGDSIETVVGVGYRFVGCTGRREAQRGDTDAT